MPLGPGRPSFLQLDTTYGRLCKSPVLSAPGPFPCHAPPRQHRLPGNCPRSAAVGTEGSTGPAQGASWLCHSSPRGWPVRHGGGLPSWQQRHRLRRQRPARPAAAPALCGTRLVIPWSPGRGATGSLRSPNPRSRTGILESPDMEYPDCADCTRHPLSPETACLLYMWCIALLTHFYNHPKSLTIAFYMRGCFKASHQPSHSALH